jgi:hypothetical protein
MSEKMLGSTRKNCSVVFAKGGNHDSEKKDNVSSSLKNVVDSAQSIGDVLLCTESNLSEDVPFHSTCHSAVFGQGGNVSVGLAPNFSDLASEIPRNSEFPGDRVSLGRRGTRHQTRCSKVDRQLLNCDASEPHSQSSRLGSRKTKRHNQKKAAEKSNLLLDPEHDSQFDFIEMDSMEKSLRFSGRSKRGVKSQEKSGTVSLKKTAHSGHTKFELDEELPLNTTNENETESFKFSRNPKQGSLHKTDKDDSKNSEQETPGFEKRQDPRNFTTQKSYVFDGKCGAVKVTDADADGDLGYDDDAMMADMCKSMKFGARPKTFAEEEDSQDYLDDLLNDGNIMGSKVKDTRAVPLELGHVDQKGFDDNPEEESQGLGDCDGYPCPGFVATPVDVSVNEAKRVSRRRRKLRQEETLQVDDSFDR